MGNEIIKVSPNLNVQLNYPTGTIPSIVESASIAVLSIATSLVKNGILSTGAIVEAYENTKVAIKLYQERGKYLREYVIPTVALYDAVQMGRNFVNSRDWDDDLKRMALEDINKILEKYRVR